MLEILAEVFGEALSRSVPASRRMQLLVRIAFGLLGAALGLAGAGHFALQPNLTANRPMWLSMIALFVFLAAFFLFNVALSRKWRWPGVLFVVSFVSLFATRVLFGR